MVKFTYATSQEDISHIRDLFKEYEKSLGFDLCFQDFKNELRELPGEYAPPHGCLILARDEQHIVGCVALSKIEDGTCEMKRLYVRHGFRGQSIGRKLAVAVIEEARKIGYERMRLDTISSMKKAITLYYSLGFKSTLAYRHNPIKGAQYFELVL